MDRILDYSPVLAYENRILEDMNKENKRSVPYDIHVDDIFLDNRSLLRITANGITLINTINGEIIQTLTTSGGAVVDYLPKSNIRLISDNKDYMYHHDMKKVRYIVLYYDKEIKIYEYINTKLELIDKISISTPITINTCKDRYIICKYKIITIYDINNLSNPIVLDEPFTYCYCTPNGNLLIVSTKGNIDVYDLDQKGYVRNICLFYHIWNIIYNKDWDNEFYIISTIMNQFMIYDSSSGIMYRIDVDNKRIVDASSKYKLIRAEITRLKYLGDTKIIIEVLDRDVSRYIVDFVKGEFTLFVDNIDFDSVDLIFEHRCILDDKLINLDSNKVVRIIDKSFVRVLPIRTTEQIEEMNSTFSNILTTTLISMQLKKLIVKFI